MWPFKRKKDNPNGILPEVDQYYQSERREKTGIAWLLALATLVTTIILATGIFFGGRWAYRAVTKNNKSVKTANNTKTATTVNNSPKTSPSITSNNSSNGHVSDNAASTTAPAPTSSKATVTPSPHLPNTGPTGDD